MCESETTVKVTDESMVGRQLRTVADMQAHFATVFDDRNRLYIPNQAPRINMLAVAARDLMQAHRSGSISRSEVAIARVVSRAFTVANGPGGVSVSDGLELKFPADGCLYCKHAVCQCGESRPPVEVAPAANNQRSHWGLADWQSHLSNVYAEKNRQRGIKDTLLRLTAEVVELVVVSEHTVRTKPADVRRAYEEELADVIGWSLGAANLLDIDAHLVTEQRYGLGCPTCGAGVCHCTQTQFDHIYEE